ncbi:MAG: PspC domain-containing protein [Actinophytocola sp.]|nr:PspC domain-containing protein [Actinophytocola sp.]
MTNDLNTHTPKRLRRSSSDKMIAGVCGGWAQLLGIDAAILRILLVAATIFGIGTPIVIYAICWIVMPEESTA